jgi:uncharacterized protein YjbI with pentapeptide repeats
MCKYKFNDGNYCDEEPLDGADFCILHIDFPDKSSSGYASINELKIKKINEKIIKSDFNFEGAKIPESDCFTDKLLLRPIFNGATFAGNASFDGATFDGDASFVGATFTGEASFDGVTFTGEASFDGVTFTRDANFDGANFDGDFNFYGATFDGVAWFKGATFKKDVWFDEATFDGVAWFKGATFKKDVWFDEATFDGVAWFDGATFDGYTSFNGATFKKPVSFTAVDRTKPTRFYNVIFNNAIIQRTIYFDECQIKKISFNGTQISNDLDLSKSTITGDASFKNSKITGSFLFSPNTFKTYNSQEEAFRRAKRACEEAGNKQGADEYYFKEMVAKRKQKKNAVIRYLDWIFLEKFFCYGVKPLNTFIIWMAVIGIFAGFFWMLQALPSSDPSGYIYFSIVNAMTPGYGGMHPNSGIPEIIASIEALLGTFMWASFISIFVRRFTR